MKASKEYDLPLFISPHYYYPTDHTWKFEGALEVVMHDLPMFERKGQLNIDGFTGSGSDWVEELKPYIEDGKSIICHAHKMYGPENGRSKGQIRAMKNAKRICLTSDGFGIVNFNNFYITPHPMARFVLLN